MFGFIKKRPDYFILSSKLYEDVEQWIGINKLNINEVDLSILWEKKGREVRLITRYSKSYWKGKNKTLRFKRHEG